MMSRSVRELGAHQRLRISSSLRTLSTTPFTFPPAESLLSSSPPILSPTSANTTSSHTRSATPFLRRRTQRPPPAFAASSQRGAIGERKMLMSEMTLFAGGRLSESREVKSAAVVATEAGRAEGGQRWARKGWRDST